MYNKIIIRFSFCDIDIRNSQGLGKYYQSQPSSVDNTYLDFDYSVSAQNLNQ